MTQLQSFCGTAMEMLSIVILMGVFSPDYRQAKWKLLIVIMVASATAVAGECLQLPMMVQYAAFTLITVFFLCAVTLRSARFVFFEFILADAVTIGIEFFLIILHPQVKEAFHKGQRTGPQKGVQDNQKKLDSNRHGICQYKFKKNKPCTS